MSGMFARAKSVLSNREMLYFYAKWQYAWILGGRPTLSISGAELSGFTRFSYYWGAWGTRPSIGEINLLKNLSGGAGALIDIGGNYGIFTILMSKAAPEARIFSFEPVERTFSRLKNNVETNECRNVEVVRVAVGDCRRKVLMHVDDSLAENHVSLDGRDKGQIEEVEMVALDEFLEEKGISFVDFLKVDVEGAECMVLRGARNLFIKRRVRKMLIEICPGNLIRANTSPEQLYDMIKQVGYACFHLTDAGALGSKVSLSDFENVPLQNVLAVPA
jgi:FkbM family methyltransferase